jgi:hypothetical protein
VCSLTVTVGLFVSFMYVFSLYILFKICILIIIYIVALLSVHTLKALSNTLIMKERIIQLRNAEGEPFFIGMDSGKVSWTIPAKSFGQLTHMAHLSDGSACYFEDLRTQEVSWTLPFSEMSSAAINAAKVLQGCNQEDTEEWIKSPYHEDESVEIMLGIDAYLLAKEQGEESEEEDEASEEGSLDSSEQVAPSADKSPTKSNVMSGIFSADSSKIFSKDAGSDSDGQSSSGKDILPVSGAMEVEDCGDDEDESGSGGTMESDDEGSEEGDVGSATSAGTASLTAAQILSQTTIKVPHLRSLSHYKRSYFTCLVASPLPDLTCAGKQDDGARQGNLPQLERAVPRPPHPPYRLLRGRA